MTDCPLCINPDCDPHPFVHAALARSAAQENELLRLRLEQADGPRLRVNELERIVETLNARIAASNRSNR